MPLEPPVVILADGDFPTHHRPLEALRRAGTLICCDGAANHLLGRFPEPDVVVGDLDSISADARFAFRDRLVELPSQQSNDLEKALKWAAKAGAREVTIIGAIGQRDDHSFGNLVMLWNDFGLEVTVLTDAGQFTPVRLAHTFDSFPGQNVSLFPESTAVRITTSGLVYQLKDAALIPIHKGTSNRSRGTVFTVEVSGGAVLVFQSYPPEG
ncbi:MAG: thiamine diphosphokinase [Candidatus Neomarinimicrobiota bacterium]